jgi:hypothetical protein
MAWGMVSDRKLADLNELFDKYLTRIIWTWKEIETHNYTQNVKLMENGCQCTYISTTFISQIHDPKILSCSQALQMGNNHTM